MYMVTMICLFSSSKLWGLQLHDSAMPRSKSGSV